MDEMDVQEMLEKCQQKAESLFSAVRDQHLSLRLTFSGEPLPAGWTPASGPGGTLLPSRTEMQDLAELISLALSSWTQSGKMPTVEQLHSSAQSTDVDPVVYITMLYCTAMLGAFLPLICSGDLATAYSILDVMNQAEAQPGTSPSTSLKRPRRRLSGPSITDFKESAPLTASGTSKNEKPDGSSGSGTSSKRKKKARINPGRKRRKKKTK